VSYIIFLLYVPRVGICSGGIESYSWARGCHCSEHFFDGKNYGGDPHSERTFHYNKKDKGLYIQRLTESIKTNTKG
jgi:hypothetical protein